MRWQELFDDLESQADAAARLAEDDEVAELQEAELGRIALTDRLRAGVGRRLVVGVDGESYAGVVVDAARAWLVLRTEPRDVLVPTAAVRWVEGAAGSAPEPGGAESRLTLAHVLRRVAADETVVRVMASGRTLVGTVGRVGLDHVDVVQDGSGTVVAVPFVAIASVAL